ncbi:filament-like plant protein 3 isoform X1 [Abrus precatorius]|uniref:Filament-like plant protein 3 isoform X1 n=1 Tax=Abrus precatorius TaxID=3816 RepID=A0A8B8KDR7_ABRPR|nr:filament-like plant protein 3 isoform X1 [Abrus precatorius]XP_027341926.1 filament-like plant protein 3 isoform X1 [Abrus precatorius]XP_027341927.1 filament-like plant protein 3 isoform X1 [Abrus precatorius]XP_027341928.1 filament-like plant protein 3 isoform X1 [Abrus precatorius]XP_027341929.1 filament-like plant protein 3 isoform X1 [Abrus precatorius]XP_027341930.1 filament-like plant protein 3 isoform X1 [Abrus precatorius]
MDRRSWLWRRKSSEKSPGETESSGSISSLSERFSDDQVYPAQAALSPEVTSKAVPNEEEISTPKKSKEVSDVKILTDKLAAALLNISAKEDLVKQHAKVAEEAVTGWEKAENEVSSLKQQLDASRQKNTVLEDRVSHLDGALKECMRQLRQAREVQEQKIVEAAVNNSRDWESKRSELEGKVAELEAQLQTAKADAAASIRFDLHQKLEVVEKENSSLKLELESRLEELEFRIVERDLSAQAAETASKQHLECVKKVAKLEAECRRLKAMTRKTVSVNDHRPLTASSVYVESFTDSMSDSGERLLAVESDMHKLGGWEMNECEPNRFDSWSSSLVTELDQFKNPKANGKNHMVPSTEINLMDDFLEMERLAALPDTESGRVASDQSNVGQASMKAEVEAMIQKNSQLEKKLKKMESEVEAMILNNAELEKKMEKMDADKLEVEMVLTECQMQLEASDSRIREAELKVAELQTQLALANKSNQEASEELKATKTNKEIVESQLKLTQTEVDELISKIHSLKEEIQEERALSAENSFKRIKLEDELSRMKHEAQVQQDTEILHRQGVNNDLKLKQEKELALAASKFSECQKTIASLGKQLRSLATLEDFLLDSDNPMELTCEITQGLQNGGEQLKLHHSDLSLPKIDSETPISLNSSITNEKSRSGFGKFIPRSRSVSKTRSH